MVFDGKHVLIAAKSLNLDSRGGETFVVEVPEVDDFDPKTDKLIKVTIKVKLDLGMIGIKRPCYLMEIDTK